MRTVIIIIILVSSTVLFYSFNIQDTAKWDAPVTADKVKNPSEATEKNIALGKKIYNKMCWSCHGTIGMGDGPAGEALNPKPADFTLTTFQKQSDGAIFWKINTGRGTMANYENSLSEDQRWAVINYLRTLKK